MSAGVRTDKEVGNDVTWYCGILRVTPRTQRFPGHARLMQRDMVGWDVGDGSGFEKSTKRR